MRSNQARIVEFGGMQCIEMQSGNYIAMVAPEVGSNVIRFRDEYNEIEFFRFNPENTKETYQQHSETWGLPTLYLPNRFEDGVLKTTDAVYHLPVNEKAPYNNHIHGFLQKREHQFKECGADSVHTWCRTEYLYDERDEFFQYLPIKFKAEFLFILSENGLDYTFKLTNLSDKQMPISVATHTTISAPFCDNSKPEKLRLLAPIGSRWVLNERCLPTEEFIPLTEEDLEYKEGTRMPVIQNIDNEMYFAESLDHNGEKFHGIVVSDVLTGKQIGYEVSDNYLFWIFWNDKGVNGYFCPEPMSAMINAPNMKLPPAVTGYQELKPGKNIVFTQHFFTVSEED